MTTTRTTAVARFPMNRHGLTVDPVGEFVALDLRDRRLLGEVVAVRRDDIRGCFIATVQHFNGEAWPIEPIVSALEWVRQNWTTTTTKGTRPMTTTVTITTNADRYVVEPTGTVVDSDRSDYSPDQGRTFDVVTEGLTRRVADALAAALNLAVDDGCVDALFDGLRVWFDETDEADEVSR